MKHEPKPHNTVLGLILRNTGREANEFKRLGMFSFKNPRLIDGLAVACKEFDSRAVQSGLEFWEGDAGQMKYKITII